MRALLALSVVLFATSLSVLAADDIHYTPDQLAAFSKKFDIGKSEFYFPTNSFLEAGYSPPGGYVKDFSIISYEGRFHLFHIDGRPGEKCWVTGNEIAFGHASTEDLRHWIRHRMPISISDRPWENDHVWAPFVGKWHDRFYMFYMASGVDTPGVLTYATSDNLEKWTKWPDGPIRQASGRDPFMRSTNDEIFLYYTSNKGGIEAVKSRDMINWSPCGTVIRNPDRFSAESSSVEPYHGRYVLWYNDYLHTRDASGDFRSVYAFSGDPLKFDPKDLRVFNFTTTLPTKYVPDDWVEKRPIPVSIELVESGKDLWLVAYFRWHIDRFRLFFGALHWDEEPARIEEIVTSQRLDEVRAKIRADIAKNSQ